MNARPVLSKITKLPKIELHAHLTASVTRQSFQKLLRMKGLDDDVSFFDCKDYEDTFRRVFRLLWKIVDCKRDLEYLTTEVFEGFKEDNIKYLEIRTTPKPLSDITILEYTDAVISSMKAYEKSMPIRLVLSVNRNYPPEHYQEIFDELKTNQEWQKWIVGICYCGDPWERDVLDYKHHFDVARDLGLKLTIHTAEVPTQMAETGRILSLRPERIGHFVNVHDEELEQVREMGSLIEVCPSSNIVTNHFEDFSEHNMMRMLDSGFKVGICTDDILLFENNLSEEIQLVCDTFGLDYEFCQQMTLDSLEHAFCEEEVKTRVRPQILEGYESTLEL